MKTRITSFFRHSSKFQMARSGGTAVVVGFATGKGGWLFKRRIDRVHAVRFGPLADLFLICHAPR